MTHILITDSREIRHMAYVPERCTHVGSTMRDAIIYRKELEKAKRESLPFENLEDREKVLQVLYGHTAHLDLPLNYQKWKEEIKPGIYQVPVEVGIVEICNEEGCVVENSPLHTKVARIKLPEPKEESQEQIFTDVFQRLYDCLERGHGSFQSILSDFEITRKRG